MIDVVKLYKEACAQNKAGEKELQNEQRKREKRVAWRRTFRTDWILFCILSIALVILRSHSAWWLLLPMVGGPLIGALASILRTRCETSEGDWHSDNHWLETCCSHNSNRPRNYFVYDYTPRVLCYWIWRIGKYGIRLQKQQDANINPDDPDVIMTVINYLEKKVDAEENSIRNQIQKEITSSNESISDLDVLVRELKLSLGREPDPKSLDLDDLTLIEATEYHKKITEYLAEQNRNLKKCGEITAPLREEIQKKRKQFTLRNRLRTMTKSMEFIEASERKRDVINKSIEGLYNLAEGTQKALNEIGVDAGAKAKTMRECGMPIGVS